MAYKKFYSMDFLTLHFKDTNPEILQLINTYRINENIEKFDINEISKIL